MTGTDLRCWICGTDLGDHETVAGWVKDGIPHAVCMKCDKVLTKHPSTRPMACHKLGPRSDTMDKATTLLIRVPNAVGFYERVLADGTHRLYRVRWNKKATARYAEELLPPEPTPTRPDVIVRRVYRGQEPLHVLTTAERVSSTSVLRTFADQGPYDTCMWCHRGLDEPLTRAFGMGRHCADKHLGVPRKVLEVLFRHTPPTGPGTPLVRPTPTVPAITRGHLRLVAVNGELVAA